MKANMQVEIDSEEISYYLKSVIQDIASKEIKQMVKSHAEEMVKEEVKRIISPIVDSYLETAMVGREHLSYHDTDVSRRNIDDYIAAIMKRYLDEPVYLYSKSSSELSKRYNKDSHNHGSRTRADYWVIEKVKQFADTELYGKIEKNIESVIASVIPNEDKIREMIKEEIKNKF